MYDVTDEKRAEYAADIIKILNSAVERKSRDVNRFKEMISETDSEELKDRYNDVIIFIEYEIDTSKSALLYLTEGKCELPEHEPLAELESDLENILEDYYSALDEDDVFFYEEVSEVLDVFQREIVMGIFQHLGELILTDKQLREIALSDEDMLIGIGEAAYESGLFNDVI